MPPKKVVAKVSSMAVTPEEVASAWKLLENLDEKGKRSKMASMVHLCKNSDDAAVLGSRGAAREEYLEKFIIYQRRNEDAKRTTTTTKETNHVREKENEKEWMGLETMDTKLGPTRAKYLREKAGLILTSLRKVKLV